MAWQVDSADAALGVLVRGEHHRAHAATFANRCSSRSHAIFKVSIGLHRSVVVHVGDAPPPPRDGDGPSPTWGRSGAAAARRRARPRRRTIIRRTHYDADRSFFAVDLAGSERVGRVVNRASRKDRKLYDEGSQINVSLMCLGTVIAQLGKEDRHAAEAAARHRRTGTGSAGSAGSPAGTPAGHRSGGLKGAKGRRARARSNSSAGSGRRGSRGPRGGARTHDAPSSSSSSSSSSKRGPFGPHVSFRDSKLTRLLQPVLEAGSRTCVLCCVSPSIHARRVSVSTLDFARRCQQAKPGRRRRAHARVNRTELLLQYKEES